MDRRNALKASVGLVAAGLAAQACLESAQAAAEGDRCPIYPYAFHGSYTSYYAMIFHTAAPCNMPHTFDGPNGLGSGCGGSGCSAAKEDKIRKNNNHGDLKKKGMKKKPDASFEPALAPEVEINSTKKIYFRGKNPKTGSPDVFHAKIFKMDMKPKKFDVPESASLPDKDNDHVGFEIASGTPEGVIDADESDGHCFLVTVDGKQYRITIEDRR